MRASGPIAPFALIGRAQQDIDRLQAVLQGFGYYQGKVTVTVDGVRIDDPRLPDAIDALAKETNASIKVMVEVGPLYHLRKVTIEGEIPENARAKLGIQSGDPAVASEVLKAQERLLTALQEDGYALAAVDLPVAYEDPAAQVLDVTYKVRAGPRVDIGEISVTGLQHVNASIVRNRLLVRTGERYSPSQIEKARQDLLSLGVFAGVTVRAVDQLDAQGRVPVVFDVQERLRRAVGLTAAYSTDLGGSARATWSHRNLFGNAEQLNLSAGITGLGGRATTGLGYNLTAQYIKPDFLVRDQSLEFNVGAIRQKLDAYDQDALTAGVLLNRKFSDVWSASVGLAAERERIVQDSVTRDYTLLGVPVSVKYNSTGIVNPLMDPVRGIRAALTVTPTQSFGASSATFVIIQGNAAAYIDLASIGWTAPGRSVIALRTLIGSAQGASLFSLPPDQRFYGGGSGTVRGFRYQSIGPQFSSGKPIGGNSIDTATIELRQRLVGNFGAAAFIDAGQVSADSAPFQGTVRVGAGIGMRYYTPIGPIRLDVAAPLNKQPGGDAFEVYIGLGQAF
ncbi:MAG TPA: BamA/TamA family outer membrane protein [Burkholderiales bacterium]|nr:BamA/TamA family outer membrane protein [Burkholderiales bacterium]